MPPSSLLVSMHNILLAVVAISWAAVSAQVPEQEITALFELYHSTNGTSWRWRDESISGSKWNFTRDGDGIFLENPCSRNWQGIACSKNAQLCSFQTCQITELRLPAYNLTGSIPSEIGNLVALQWLLLIANALTGSIPSEVGNLEVLVALDLSFNKLTASIPRNISNLVMLDILYLAGNALTGTIPSEIGNLVALINIDLGLNFLSGSIPSEIGNLVVLEILDLDHNRLSKFIPNEIGDLKMLTDFDLRSNSLTGSIPPAVGNLISLEFLYINDNALTGSIPSDIGNLVGLERFDLENNALTSSIPNEMGNLLVLRWLDLSGNALSGSIPGNIGNVVTLEYLDLSINALTQSIPSEIGNLLVLEVLYLDNNALTGPVPREVGSLEVLERLDLESNVLTGSIPMETGNLLLLARLDFGNNALTGSIPTKLGSLVLLQWLVLAYNSLVGPIPRDIGNIVGLETLDFSDNSLSHSIPNELQNLVKLQFLFLQANSLTGRIDRVFNTSTQRVLEVIDLTDNLLSGYNLDEIVFLLPKIRVLALSVNCFQEELPTVICDAANIEVLSLNGLGAAEGCRNTVKFPFSDVSLFNAIGGTLPECVWHLRNLTTLHLTGNGLTGEIIPQLPDSSRMTDLSLSHNQLSGTIPRQIHRVQKVDLSHNQFAGSFEDYAGLWTNILLDLEINRVSGRLPVSKLENVSDLKILRGNMVSCDTIPNNDEFQSDYICGSEDLNESLYVFAAALFVACCMALATCLAMVTARRSVSSKSPCVPNHLKRLRIFMTSINQLKTANTNLQPIIDLFDKCKRIMWLCVYLLFVMLVVGAPIYIVRAIDNDDALSTHTNTYAWFWTLAYLRGVVPSSLILMSWAVTVTACFYRVILTPPVSTSLSPRSHQEDLGKRKEIQDSIRDDAMKSDAVGNILATSLIIGVLLVNAAITITVNTLYIYATQQPLSPLIQLGLQLGLAVFRLVYAYCALPLLAGTVSDSVQNIGFRLRLLILNNLVIPCLVTAFASPSCFQGLLVTAGAVSTPYSYDTCNAFLNTPDSRVCLAWVQTDVDSATVTPPFVYNNQCASVLLTSYIPVLILGFSMQIVLCFIIPPFLSQVGKWINLPAIIHRNAMNGILWPEYWLNSDDSDLVSRNHVDLEKDPTIIINPLSILCFNILNNLMIMLTFGLCSPVLAVAVACTVVSKMSELLLLIGRFTHVLRGDCGHFALVALAKVHFPVTEVLRESFWVMVWTSALFFSLVCWDIASDDVGWAASLWIPVTTISYPLFLWLMTICRKYRNAQSFFGDGCDEKMSDTRDTDVELMPSQVLEPAATPNVAENPMHSDS